ncbi:hypothetical protein K503DRAFT_773340, partial [Rhizopogon vinicolor AM-OR11-026]
MYTLLCCSTVSVLTYRTSYPTDNRTGPRSGQCQQICYHVTPEDSALAIRALLYGKESVMRMNSSYVERGSSSFGRPRSCGYVIPGGRERDL